jgi:hypothetical protein
MVCSESTQAVLVTDILARMVCSESTQVVLVTDILLARIVCSESTQAVLVTDILARMVCSEFTQAVLVLLELQVDSEVVFNDTKGSQASIPNHTGIVPASESCSASTAAPPIRSYILDGRIFERLPANDGPISWNRMEATSLFSHGIQGLIYRSC